ncbi:MAG TPA: galactokinase [Clostridiales bacterium]|nr:galactokinase [Clostridiales bacterium]
MDFKTLYGEHCDIARQEKRFNDVRDAFVKEEGCEPEYYFSSSGRAEILGNHTDHNHGKVMVAAISCDIVCAVKKTDDNKIVIASTDYNALTVDINDTELNKKEYGSSLALTKGIVHKLKEMGYKFGGFVAHTESNIFKGAGVSSSAAFEVMVCEIINKLYLNEALDEVTKAVISQYSENVYFGKPCGLLDQSGISIGSLTKLDFNEPEKPVITKLTPPKGYTLVITNTGGNHASLTKHYADIRIEMEEVAEFFGKKVLRDVDYNDFMSKMDKLNARFPGRAILRALHFFNENKRVDEAEKALKSGDTKKFLECVNESGRSSLTLLQNCCVPGDIEQPVVLGIELSRQIIKDGAIRVHGGGFAGSIIAFVADKEVKDYTDYMKKVFGNDNVFVAEIRMVGTTFVK